jgi:hypothetical protein
MHRVGAALALVAVVVAAVAVALLTPAAVGTTKAKVSKPVVQLECGSCYLLS